MWWVSQRDSSVFLYLVLLFLMMRKFQLSMWKVLIMIAILVIFNDQLASGVFKPWVARLRPSHEPSLGAWLHLLRDENGNFYKGGLYGFYSSHAANTMAAAVFFMLVMRPLHVIWTIVLFIWVFLVGLSRVYLGVHYPTDVLMGWAMGAVSAVVFWKFLKSERMMKWHRLPLY
jgi:undecaprenyl-diphosphatase